MAKLFLAKDESHYYIVAGKSQGTFQLSLAGLFWLAQMQTPFPRPGRQRDEGVPLTRGTFRKLRDEGYLFTKGLSLSATTSRPGHHKHDDDDQEQDTDEASVPAGLPLLLRTEGEGPEEHWQLFLDLSDLGEETWLELQQLVGSTADARLLAGRKELASSESLRHLFLSPLLPVHPQAEAYQLCCQLPDGHGYHQLGAAPRTPGLCPTWQGTLFYQEEDAELPRRLLRGERIKLYAGIRLYWLVQNNHDVQRGLLRNWPGSARPLGPAVAGWQLWQLELPASILSREEARERLRRWSSYSELELQPPSGSLMLLSPPLLLPEEGSPVLRPHSQVIVGYKPPASLTPAQFGQAVAMTLDLRLQKEGFGPSLERRFSLAEETTMVYVGLDGLLPGMYQLWSGQQPGQLAFAVGSHDEEAAAVPWPPELLAGLRCVAIMPSGLRQEFSAFSPTAEEALTSKASCLQVRSAEEAAALHWELTPAGLPVRVSWHWCTAGAVWQRNYAFSPVVTSEELTDLWQQQIWPALARASQARLIFDGGGLGCLEIALSPVLAPVAAPPISTAQRAQLLWLSHCIAASPTAEPGRASALPAPLLQRLRSLEQAARRDDPPLALALRRLLTARLQPWIVARLMAVFQEH